MKWKILLPVILIITGCSQIFHGDENPASWAYQLQNADPHEIARSGFDIVVMDYSFDGSAENRYSPSDISLIKDAGILPIAYVSIGEAENYRFYWNPSWDSLPPPWLGPENPDWGGNYAVKYWDTTWQRIIYTYLDTIVWQGFRGVYLDKVDEFEFWSLDDSIMSEQEAAERMINFVVAIARYCKSRAGEDFYVIPQNGEQLIMYDSNGDLLREISGWAVEDMFYDGLLPIPQTITEKRAQYLEVVLNTGRMVLSVDYVDDGTGYVGQNKIRIDDYRRKAQIHGYIPYAARSDRELDELNIIDGIQPGGS